MATWFNWNQEENTFGCSNCLRDSLFSIRYWVIVFLPEDDRRRHTHNSAFQPDRSSFRNTHVLQLFQELRRILHLFFWRGTDFNDCGFETRHKGRALNHLVLTHDSQFQAKRALPRFVACNAGVCTRVLLAQRINDQRVDSIFPHQHLVIQVWVDRSPVDQPHQLRGGQTTHLEDKKTVQIQGRWKEI